MLTQPLGERSHGHWMREKRGKGQEEEEQEGEWSPGHHEERRAPSSPLTGSSLTVTTGNPQELCQGVSEMGRQVLCPEPMVQGENQLSKVVLQPLCICCSTQAHTHNNNK